jgi:hypothetical protein
VTFALAHLSYAFYVTADYASCLTNIKTKTPGTGPGVVSLVQRYAVAKE